jgi:hypothetical protein
MWREALATIPPAILSRVGTLQVRLLDDPGFGSRWRRLPDELEIEVDQQGVEEHDLAMEVLLCVGQALWETTTPAEREAWLRLVGREIEEGVEGDLDEDALLEKRALLGGAESARSRRRLLRYAGASFASTVAEWIHSRWHEVEVREGPEHLPAECIERRWDLMERWFGRYNEVHDA